MLLNNLSFSEISKLFTRFLGKTCPSIYCLNFNWVITTEFIYLYNRILDENILFYAFMWLGWGFIRTYLLILVLFLELWLSMYFLPFIKTLSWTVLSNILWLKLFCLVPWLCVTLLRYALRCLTNGDFQLIGNLWNVRWMKFRDNPKWSGFITHLGHTCVLIPCSLLIVIFYAQIKSFLIFN